MIHPISSAGAPSEAPPLEVLAARSTLERDIYNVLAAVRPALPVVSVLAERAIINVELALRYAAGRPGDRRWRIAYDALQAYVDCCRRYSNGVLDGTSFVRLCAFLAENADLAGQAAPALQVRQALATRRRRERIGRTSRG